MTKTSCIIAGCAHKLHARNLCKKHYQRQMRIGSAELPRDSWVDQAAKLLRERPHTIKSLALAMRLSIPTSRKIVQAIGARVLYSHPAKGGGHPTVYYTTRRADLTHSWSAILETLQDRKDLPASEIATIAGTAPSDAIRHLNRLHSFQLVHISGWRAMENNHQRLWSIGPWQDAPKPRPMSIAERNEKRKKREDKDPDLRESRLNMMRRYYLRSKFKPKRDPLVAALFGDAA